MENKLGLKNFFKSKTLGAILIIGLLLNLAVWAIFWFSLDFDRTALILHYNSFFGIDKFSLNSTNNRFMEIFFAPLSGLLILFINYLLGGFLVYSGWKKTGEEQLEKISSEKFSASILGGFLILMAGIILQLIILIYSVAIVLVNK